MKTLFEPHTRMSVINSTLPIEEESKSALRSDHLTGQLANEEHLNGSNNSIDEGVDHK